MTRLLVEDDLRNALAVEPSRSFAAGVRARIATAPEARVRRRLGFWIWMPASALATAALVVALRPSRAPAASTRLRPLAARSTVSTPAPPPAAASSVRQQRAVRSVRTREPREPEILISPSESRAILTFIEGPRTWQIDPSPRPIPSPAADLVIDPIVIPPLSVDGGQGARQ
jgi:hypothetical protein